MRSLMLAVLALSLCACSIFNKPDRGRLDGNIRDGGVDDAADATDGGNDAGHDAWICPGGNHEVCGNGQDDDCDGQVDCADPDCIADQAPQCCATGTTPAVTETFTRTAGTWPTRGNWVGGANIEGAISAAGTLSEMGTGPAIGAVNTACLQVDLGAQLRFDLTASACSATDCTGHLDVVVGPSTSFMGSLTDDLAVRARNEDGNLYVDVVQGGTVRMTSAPLGASTRVIVDLAPGLSHADPPAPAIVGTVSVMGRDGLVKLVEEIYVTDRDVFGTSTCHGLRVGVQGVGSHVGLDNVRIAQLDCSNPARFGTVQDDADEIDNVTVSAWDPTHGIGWGRGGIGDPALFEGQLTSHPGMHSFTLLYDGSPVDRASDVIGHLPLSIGGADTTAHGTHGDLALIDDCSLWTPRGITTRCTPQMSATGHAVIEAGGLVMRDPTLYPLSHELTDVAAFRVAWVGETAAGSPLSLFIGILDVDPVARIVGTSPATIHDETCASIRNPLLLPIASSTDFLLLYVCDTFPPVVHGARMVNTVITRIADFELGPAELGPLAAQGVIDMAGVVYDYPISPGPPVVHLPTYRLWLVTRPTTTDTAVLYVEGHPPEGAAEDASPTFTRFAGNPVLTETSPVFGSCALGCQIHGIAATRMSDDPTRVRLLVERWVDTGSGLSYGLVPLEQIWPSDH